MMMLLGELPSSSILVAKSKIYWRCATKFTEGPNTPQETTTTQIIENVLVSLEPEGPHLAYATFKADKEGISGKRGLKAI